MIIPKYKKKILQIYMRSVYDGYKEHNDETTSFVKGGKYD